MIKSIKLSFISKNSICLSHAYRQIDLISQLWDGPVIMQRFNSIETYEEEKYGQFDFEIIIINTQHFDRPSIQFISQKNQPGKCFVSSVDDFLKESFTNSKHVYHYIKNKTTALFIHQISPRISVSNSLFLYSFNKKNLAIEIPQINYFESRKRVIAIHSKNQEDYFYEKLSNVEDIINQSPYKFVRIHQSYLISCNFIRGYNKSYIQLSTGETLTISSSKRKSALFSLERAFSLYP